MYQMQYPFRISFNDVNGHPCELIINVWVAKSRTGKYVLIVRDGCDESTWRIADITEHYNPKRLVDIRTYLHWGIAEYLRMYPYEFEGESGINTEDSIYATFFNLPPPWKMPVMPGKNLVEKYRQQIDYYPNQLALIFKDLELKVKSCW